MQSHTHLLLVLFRVGQHGGDVEHELMTLIHRVDGFNSCSVICRQKQKNNNTERKKKSLLSDLNLKAMFCYVTERVSILTLGVQPSSVTCPSLQRDGITQQTQKLVKVLAPRLCDERRARIKQTSSATIWEML